MDERRHNLPAQPTPLIDRVQELAGIRRRLRRADVRLLTLVGPAGVGKTRLAVEAAAAFIDDLEDGVWFVDLARIRDPALVPAAVGRTLATRNSGSRSALDRLMHSLRNRQLLLVLDNFEHVLPAASAVAELLRDCPRLKVLATSRAPLHLRWERLSPVPPLGLPHRYERTDPKTLMEYAAVALFVERTHAVMPDFVLDASNATMVAELCDHLEGLPLSIELAAARANVFSPRELLARLADARDAMASDAVEARLDLLTGGARDLPARHQTLRAAIAWSYDLLGPAEQALLRSVASFVGGFTLDAAEAIGRLSPQCSVLDLVATLVDHSLVRREFAVDGRPRFRMLETIREYALERLDAAGETDAVRWRHAEFFLALAEQAEPGVLGTWQANWLRRLEGEYDNLRAALEWVSEHRDAQAGLRLGWALWLVWFGWGAFAEGRRWLARLLARDGASAPTMLRARVLFGAGRLAYEQSDYAEAGRLSEEAVVVAREVQDHETTAAALTTLGHIARARGEYRAARCFHQESLTIRQALADRWGIAVSLKSLGHVAFAEGDHETARDLYEQSLDIDRAMGHRWELALTLQKLGDIAHDRSNPTEARACYEECLAIAREFNDRRLIAGALEGFAGLAAAQDRPELAPPLAGAAAALRETIGTPLPPSELAALERRLNPARRALGERRCAELQAAGRSMLLDEVIANALAEVAPAEPDRPVPPLAEATQVVAVRVPASPSSAVLLTPRQRDVAKLIAHGLTNRQIADELVIGERTVEMHVSNILAALDLTSRAQIAVWAAEQLRPNTVPNLRVPR